MKRKNKTGLVVLTTLLLTLALVLSGCPGSDPDDNKNLESSNEYQINVKTVTYGSISASSTTAKKGDTVTLTIAPNSNAVLMNLSITDSASNDIAHKGVKNNERTFTMPASNVTISGTFATGFTPWEFEVHDGWNKPENSDWNRWNYDYTNHDTVITEETYYSINLILVSNHDIDNMAGVFVDRSEEVGYWDVLTDYFYIGGNLIGNTYYPLTALAKAKKSSSGNTGICNNLRILIDNRHVAENPILYISKIEIKQIEKVDSKDSFIFDGVTLNVEYPGISTIATQGTYHGKDNVIYIKPGPIGEYDDFPLNFELKNYSGKTIEIKMEMDVWVNEASWVAWQINSHPEWPVVCGKTQTDGPALEPGIWHNIKDNYTFNVPEDLSGGSKGDYLFLSGYQLNNAEAYFAIKEITITPKN